MGPHEAQAPAAGESRQLAAVVFLDMVGYSGLMQESEQRAEAAVQALWGLARPILARHGGREERLFGDGMLITYGGTQSAVRSCLEVLEALAVLNRARAPDDRIRTRAGVHLGDIGRRDREIFGDGVNIAARLVALAPPGGIVVSPHVRDQIANSVAHPLKSIGVKVLKNIRAPIELFCLPGPECTAADLAAAADSGVMPARCWRFGAASLDERSLELKVAGQAVDVDRKSLEVLRHLLLHAGEVVTKEELREAGGLGTDAALTRCITRLRDLLRDADQSQIRLQQGYGYRLAVPVAVEAAPSAVLTQFDFKAGDHPPQRPLWSLVRMLGQGGQGEVWLGRHDKTREERVYKFALDPAKLTSLKREITLSRLLHSTGRQAHFVRVVDWNLEFPPYFLECEYGGGCDMTTWAERRGGVSAIPLAERLDLAAQIAEALAAAHSVGVLHKDLKPANVLVGDGTPPTVKLADFGSGGVLDPDRLGDVGITRMGFTRTVLDMSDASSGTPVYFAPELLAGQPATVQADVYALGVVLYQLVVGDLRRPLATGWESDVADELLREDIADATQGNPARRLGDVATLAQRLRGLESRRVRRAAERAAQDEARRVREAAERAQRKLEQMRARRVWMLAAGAALAVGTAVSLFLYVDARRARDAALVAVAAKNAVTDFLTADLFEAAGNEDAPVRDLTARQLLDRASAKVGERFSDQPEVAAQAHDALARSYYSVSAYQEAIRHWHTRAELLEKTYGRHDPRTLDALEDLAHAFASTYRVREALPLIRELLPLRLEQFGPDHPKVLQLRMNLAECLVNTGDLEEAVAEARDVLAIAVRASADPARDERVLHATAALAMALYWVDFAQAEPYLRRLVAMTALLYGEHTTYTAGAREYLASALSHRGRLDEAEALLTVARADQAAWFGEEHDALAFSLYQLGAVRLQQGRVPEAIVLLEDALRRGTAQATGPLGDVAQWLGEAYLDAGRAADAVRMLQTTVAQYDTASEGPDHRDVLGARAVLARALIAHGRTKEARRVLEANRPEALARLPEKHFVLGYHKRAEGLLWQAENDRPRARAALGEAFAIYELRFGEASPLTARVRNELARVRA